MSTALLVKIFAAPALIGLASLAGKRWGPNVAGLMGGLPLVGGPVVLALWLSQGSPYAIEVARAAPVGVWANIVYMLLVGYASARWRWYIAIPIGWAGYVTAGLALDFTGLSHSALLGLAVLPGLWLAATRCLPKPQAAPPPARLPRIELVTRMLAAATLVLSLTAAASLFGPTLTGIFTGAPVAATVIPAFTFANAGRDALLLALRGFLTGLMGFAVFFMVLGHSADALGGWAFAPALVAGLLVGLVATRLAGRAS
ncbi:hypothetical protein FNU76_07610 [Chitinimonas arctica]|uniref:Uncharacterized protein n=1 Tax=Chitinimonas arctica TaxID=2594795 RepID=A0A516SDK3_9NEIS|nr:hypothetical protein [Chitinimonas arctica]QDQ26237.1 hypothetical protein FNU76_07610 [Chitinimonas arctica]